MGYLPFKAHRKWERPASITIREETDGSWWLSFSVTLENLPEVKKPEPASRVVGVDRGVVLPVATSDGRAFVMPEKQMVKMQRRQKRIEGLSRQLARQQKGSNRRARTKRKLAGAHRAQSQSRKDFAHKTSHALVKDNPDVIVFEDLRLKNMTASGRGTAEAPGRNVAQKSGLNRALLGRSLGQISLFTQYKARRRGILYDEVPAYGTSQECSRCGFTSPKNRLTQAEFYCQACGFRAHADHQAAGVVAGRWKRDHFPEQFWFVRAHAPPNPPLGTIGVRDAFRV